MLLFQYKVIYRHRPAKKRRLCEEQIVVLMARSAREALRRAKRRAMRRQIRYQNPYGDAVRFEFVGVVDVRRLDPVCEPDEVWWRMFHRALPMHRARFVPSDEELIRRIA